MRVRNNFTKISLTEIYFLALFVLTILVIGWQHYGMKTSFEISKEALSQVQSINDSINGGVSIGRATYNEHLVSLDCQTQRSHTFAFCSLLIPLTHDSARSIDLTRFESVTISLSYQEERDQHDTVLIYLLNQEQANKAGSKLEGHRANLATITPQRNTTATYTLPLTQFAVPSWWAYSHPELTDHSHKLDKVQYIQIATGDSHSLKKVKIQVSRIQFHGKWVYSFNLYRILLAVWLLSAFISLVVRHNALSYLVSKKNRQVSALRLEKNTYAKLSQRDHLTQALNRKGLEDLYQKHKTRKGTTLILFDVDNFKRVNDELGHHEGDTILKQIAQVTTSQLRSQDALVRWGGEEFLVICFDTPIESAAAIAERVRMVIEQTIETRDQYPVTCTFGVAALNHSIEKNVIEADKALYKGKRKSKNCVIVAD